MSPSLSALNYGGAGGDRDRREWSKASVSSAGSVLHAPGTPPLNLKAPSISSFSIYPPTPESKYTRMHNCTSLRPYLTQLLAGSVR